MSEEEIENRLAELEEAIELMKDKKDEQNLVEALKYICLKNGDKYISKEELLNELTKRKLL